MLYTGPRKNNDKNVFDFKDNKLGSRIVKNFKAIVKPTYMYATEHIIELQTIAMFMEFAVKQNSALDTFFRSEWSRKLSATSIAARKGKPSYKLTKQDTLMALIFEPMGSISNPTNYVLCEQQINLYKERLWSAKKALMEPETYKETVKNAVKGAVPSSDYLSALRLVNVMAKFRDINNNIKLELSNVGALTNQPNVDLIPIWNAFLVDRISKAESWGTAWLASRFPETEKEIDAAIKKYRAMYRQLQQEESGVKAAQHAASQKTRQNQLEQQLRAQATRRQAAEARVTTLRNSRKGKTAAQKNTINNQISVAKKNVLTEMRAEGVIQRTIHELYAHSVNLILTNLLADQSRVVEYKRGMVGLKLTRP
ncbi:hypothetical protein SLS61_009997 [Didymella pomorum]